MEKEKERRKRKDKLYREYNEVRKERREGRKWKRKWNREWGMKKRKNKVQGIWKKGIDFKEEKKKGGINWLKTGERNVLKKWRMDERIKRKMMNERERNEMVEGRGENKRKVKE